MQARVQKLKPKKQGGGPSEQHEAGEESISGVYMLL